MSAYVAFQLAPTGGEFSGGWAQAAASGFFAGVSATGNLRGGIQGAFTAGVFFGAGELIQGAELSYGQGIMLHGVAGCVTSVAGGGKCGPGALSASFSKAAGGWTKNMDPPLAFAVHAIIGGTASALGGGKFENGAATAAFGYLFNELLHVGTREEAMKRAGYEDSGSTLVNTALAFVGDADWAAKNYINYCNVFVGDMLANSFFDAPMDWRFSWSKFKVVDIYQQAGRWGDPSFDPAGASTGWALTSKPKAGDVFAYKFDSGGATGHVGIYAGAGVGIWANKTVVRMGLINKAFEDYQLKRMVFRTYVGPPK